MNSDDGDSSSDARSDSAKSTSWPPVQYEDHDWVGSIDVPRRWQSTFSGPYRAAVAPEIAQLDPVVSAATAALADEATAELARFDAEMGSEIAPFGAILLRSESAASSRIENLTASAKAVALAELGDTSKRNATEIVANTSAMTAAIALADRLDNPAILALHAALLEQHDPRIAGKWRTAQVWIGSSSYGPHTASFVPPHHTRVAAAIDDLVRFMQRRICRCCHRQPSRTPSSRRSTHFPMATAEPGAPSCTACFAASASPARSPSPSRPDC